MKILGISGIHGTIDFKRRQWPGREEREYRISQGHDSAAALVVDGELVAAVAEERISRAKHTGDFPIGAVNACLEQAGLEPSDLDEVAHGFDYGPYRTAYSLDPASAELYRDVLSPEAFRARVAEFMPDVSQQKIHHVDHHLAHAASAYYTSGWPECLVVVADGMGEAHGVTVYTAQNNDLAPIHRITARDSVGILYSLLTLHLGFEFNSDEYKVMGLAPYGDAERFRPFFALELELTDDGGWRIPLLRLARTREDHEFHTAARHRLTEQLIPPRVPESEIGRIHEDVAAALQERFNEAMLHLCTLFARRTGLARVAMAGGVALNCTASALLRTADPIEGLYVQPAASDDGTALGAALQRATVHGEAINARSPTPFFGPQPTNRALAQALDRHRDNAEITELTDLSHACDQAADLIAVGEVVAWYRGRMEFGPRALGHRSILADPSNPEMRDRINAAVKLREAFRPFAPAVTLEQVHRYFDVAPGTELPYMTINVNVRPEYANALPATTHVDGSARVQTVSRHDNPEFWSLLKAVGRRTGTELTLNTSFNVRGQPIVNTPDEAIETFLNTGIDALFLENTLIRKAGP